MNRMQRIIIIVYCIAVALACFYVPWKLSISGSAGQWAKLKYSLIWYPPPATYQQHPKAEALTMLPKVNNEIIVLEILGITAMGGMAFTLAGGFKRKIKEGE